LYRSLSVVAKAVLRVVVRLPISQQLFCRLILRCNSVTLSAIETPLVLASCWWQRTGNSDALLKHPLKSTFYPQQRYNPVNTWIRMWRHCGELHSVVANPQHSKPRHCWHVTVLRQKWDISTGSARTHLEIAIAQIL
jgi:hypothetical protein